MQSSSSVVLCGLLVVGCLGSASCVEDKPGITGTTSLRIDLLSPTDIGAKDARLPDDQRMVTFDITALDAQGELDPTLEGAVDIYVQFLGSLTPDIRIGAPLRQEVLVAGKATGVTLELPRAFGPTVLWVEHAKGDNPTLATGTSPTLWYRNPYLEDVSRPPDENSLDAYEASPLEEKQVDIDGSRHGANGFKVVTGVYAQGYTISDVACADAAGTPPCVPGPYDHVLVFTFSRPEDREGNSIVAGQRVSVLSGAISEFNGLTEVNFPKTELVDDQVRPEMIPEPTVIQESWLSSRIELEQVESSLIAVVNGELCPLDDEFATYKQWKLDIGRGCGDPINVISSGQAPDFDPTAHVGKTMPRVVGTLQPVNIGSFHVWIMYPRGLSDITLPSGS